MNTYNQHTNAVLINGVWALNHPETGDDWTPKTASDYLKAQEQAQQPEPQPEPPALTEVKITELSGAGLVKHKRDFSLVTVTQGQNVVLKGELAIDDRTFTMPIRRSKGGYELFQVVVKNGKFSATLNFAESDIYHVSSSELNMDLPQPMFNLPVNVQIDVIRAIQA